MNRQIHRQRRIFGAILLGLLSLVVWSQVRSAAPASEQLHAAWRRASTLGQVTYRTVTVQTITPTERLENVGRRAHTQRMEISGTLDRPGTAATLHLRNGAPGAQQVIDLKLEDGQAFGRTGEGSDWQQIEGLTDLFAPGGDPLGFLSAATNIRTVDGQTPDLLFDGLLPTAYTADISRYAFDLDGPDYAVFMRDQTEASLRQRGELPSNLHLDLSQIYVTMQGQGEIWLGADGLPVRQSVRLTFPPKPGDAEWVTAEITTEFSEWGEESGDWGVAIGEWRLGTGVSSSLRLITAHAEQLSLSLGALLLLTGMIALSFTVRRSRYFYASVMLAVIVSMLGSPLVQAAQTVAFLDGQTAKSPVGSGDPQSAPRTTQSVNLQAQIVNLQASSAACTDATQTDSDGDGLDDDVECKKLGTYPDDVDSDGDGISDGAEVAGYPLGNPSWFLNPRNPDSNGDTLLDGIECPGLADVSYQSMTPSFVYRTCVDTDSDGVADGWDYDNDGDGVPDSVDASPFASFGDLTAGLTDHQLDFNLTLTDTSSSHIVYADFELRPVDDTHLGYTNNVLDWPGNDTEGQIQRIDNSTFEDLGYSGTKMSNGDLMLTPLLEIEVSYDATNPAAGLPITGTLSNTSADIPNYASLDWLDTATLEDYGVTVNQGEDDQRLLLWIPLTLLNDDVGDLPVAWQGRMVYFPQGDDLGADQTVRLLWIVNAIVDECDTSGMGNDDEYDVWCATSSDHWTRSTSIVQTYYEDFYVSGLTVTEDHGGALSLVAQKPGVGDAGYDEALWHAADALQQSFLIGQRNADNSRFGADDLENYLPGSDLAIERIPVESEGDLASVATVTSTLVLNSVYGASASVGDMANLLFVGELSSRSVALGDDAVSASGTQIHASLTSATLDTVGTLRWSPYVYEGAAVWDEADPERYLESLKADLSAALTPAQVSVALGGESATDTAKAGDAIVNLGWSYYVTLYLGATTLIDINGTPASSASVESSRFAYAPLSDNEAIATIAARLLEDIRAFYAANSYTLTSSSGQTITVGGTAWTDLASSLAAIADALGDAINDISSSASEALAILDNYYKVADTDTSDLTAAVTISLIHSSLSSPLGIVLGVGKVAWGIFSAVWGYGVMKNVLAFKAYVDALKTQTGLVSKAKLAWNSIELWAIVGLVLAVGIALYTYFSNDYDNALERSNADAFLAAQIIYAVIIAAITLIPGVGFLITGLISIIDGIMIAVCSATESDATTETNQWWCGGISQAITLAIYYAIHDYTPLAKLDKQGRVDVVMQTPTYAQHMTDGGYIVGNAVVMGATITSTLYLNKPTSWMGYLYPYQLSDSNLRQSTFAYRFQTDKSNVSVDLNDTDWTATPGRNTDTTFPQDERFYAAQPLSNTFTLREAAVNLELPLYFSEGFNMNAQECWAVYYPIPPFAAPICYLEEYKATTHQDLGSDFVFDVLPSTVGEFMALAETNNQSYRLGWDDEFPTQIDADGDGLRSKAKGGVDPNDSRYDTDLDGLSDYWEYANGYDPEDSDPDLDGLTDYWEAIYATNPFQADSDGDGLGDAQEMLHPNRRYPFKNSVYTDQTPPFYAASQAAWMGGWDVVYEWQSGQPLSIWVSADPNDPDSDDDTILDSREQIYGYHPWVPGTTNLLSMRSSLQTASNALPYVAAGGTITYTAVITNELENRYATGLLQAEFPTDAVQKTQVIDTISPLETVSMNGTLTVDLSSRGTTSMTVRAGVEFESATSRIIWLRMNEEAGATTFSDSTFRDHHATCSGSACPVANGSYLTFTSGDLLTLPDDDDFDSAGFSVGGWVKSSSMGSTSTIFNDANDLRLWISSSAVRVTHDGTNVTVSGANLAANTWAHVMVTYDAASQVGTIYIDGEAKQTYAASPISRDDNGITLAGVFGGTLYLDEIEVYNLALSATEVQTLVNADPIFQAAFASNGSKDTSAWGNSLSCSGDSCPDVDDDDGRASFDQTQYLSGVGR